jgi:D-alanyl-D-alanine carboxypeptidase/D-alanyl-D-alanine-endopeptidase (penicillin-binding protein 4)
MIAAVVFATITSLPELEDVLVQESLKGVIPGVCVLDAQGELIYERGGFSRVIPASNQKIMTAAYALHELGADSVITTRFWKTDDGVIVDAPGDPTITLEELLAVREELEIQDRAKVYARQAFQPGTPPSWEWDDLKYRYAAPIHGLSFDQAAFQIWAENRELDDIPDALGLTLHRPTKFGRMINDFEMSTRTLTIQGRLPRSRTMVARFAQVSPAESAAAALGGDLFPYEEALPEREPDAVLVSEPISVIVKECLEDSNNVLAEHLMLLAASADEPLPVDSYPAAAERMYQFLSETVGADAIAFRPVDGSGLSRQNLVTAEGICRVLRWCDAQPFAATMRDGLAAPGEGTMKSRLKSVPFVGKTGTINAVSALSGILDPDNGAPIYVSVIFNSSLTRSSVMRQVQDEFVRKCQAVLYDNDDLTQHPTHIFSSLPDPDARRADADRIYGFSGDSGAAFPGLDRRAEPAYAASH